MKTIPVNITDALQPGCNFYKCIPDLPDLDFALSYFWLRNRILPCLFDELLQGTFIAAEDLLYLHLKRTLRGSVIHLLALGKKDMQRDEERDEVFLKFCPREKKRNFYEKNQQYFVFIKHLMCAKGCGKLFIYIDLFNMYNNPVKQVLLSGNRTMWLCGSCGPGLYTHQPHFIAEQFFIVLLIISIL